MRFVEAEINKELYEKYSNAYKAEMTSLKEKSAIVNVSSSNLEKMIEKGLKIAENISILWAFSDFDDKRKLQDLIFPEGILYNKQTDRVRTPRINSLFAVIPSLTSPLAENKNAHSSMSGQNYRHVAPTGIEPASKV